MAVTSWPRETSAVMALRAGARRRELARHRLGGLAVDVGDVDVGAFGGEQHARWPGRCRRPRRSPARCGSSSRFIGSSPLVWPLRRRRLGAAAAATSRAWSPAPRRRVGCSAMVASKSALVALSRMAMAAICTISAASGAQHVAADDASLSPSTSSFMNMRSSRPDSVCFRGGSAPCRCRAWR